MTMPRPNEFSRQPFVILALPRTGSTLLTQLLDSHPRITCYNEPFNPDAVYAADKTLKTERMRAYRDEDPVGFTELLYSVDGAERVVGFKILEYQARDVQDHLLLRRDIRKVILRRDNLLASYSSNLMAIKVRQWGLGAGDQARKTTIEFNYRKFDDYLGRTAQYYRHVNGLIESSGSPMMALEYQELISHEVQKRLLAFLGADPTCKLKARIKRQNPGSLWTRFSNWDQVVADLSGTAMEEWLQGD